jgi:hypothetical protein
MRADGAMAAVLLSLLGVFNTALANTLVIHVAETVSKCVSLNLVKIDEPSKTRQLKVCPANRGTVGSLEDGKYRLYATEVDDLPKVNPYGDMEYNNDPIILSNESELAIYYPSGFSSTLKQQIDFSPDS